MAEDCLLEAVRGLWLAHPELGPRPLLAKLREQHPDLGAGNKEVREALLALKAEPESDRGHGGRRRRAARRPPLQRRPLRARAARLRTRRCRRASLASVAAGCRQRWATTV
jgi:hypothetical protein